ncbi:daptide-type RiPP biosynthesis aminotransferase [Paenibacillus aurantiacus]|uniref:Daptide-type RiPP biosynthesis aminotransferase n=1 Tax=Paenibacillus aurantiacus TaxID=1936118 RepID=A0ABV5KIF7_9BACL
MLTQTASYPIVHPLKDVRLGEEFTAIAAGEGIYVQDTNGRTYIDGISGLWNVSLGYRHPGIRQAVIEQLDRVPYVNPVDGANPTTLAFAERLLQATPDSLTKVAYTCTGSESVELAIKLMRKYFNLRHQPDKNRIVVLDKSYHGTYYGSMSASGIDREISESYGPKVPGFVFHPLPVYGDSTPGQISPEGLAHRMRELEQLFEQESGTLAGIILEPIIGSGGIIPLPDDYLRKVKALCVKHDVLLAFDEVATGVGRTGRMFAFEHSGVVPDILCLSKGINSGYLPLGATLFSEEIYQAFARAGSHIEHLSTQNGNPVACAAGIATLDAVQAPGMLESIERKGALLRQSLESALANSPLLLEVRGKGLMLGVALTSNKATGALLSAERLSAIVAKLKQRGLLVYPFHTPELTTGFHLFPPFIINEAEMAKMVQIIAKVLEGR